MFHNNETAVNDVYKPLTLTSNPDQHPQVAMYQSVFSHYPDGVVTVSLSGEIIDCNDAILEQFSYTKKEVRKHFIHFLPDEHKEEIYQRFEVILNGTPLQYDTEILHKDQSKISVHVTSTPISLDGKVIGLYSIIQNTSKISEAHNEVLRIKNNLIYAQQIANIGSWELDVHTGDVFWSDQVYKIFGREEWKETSLSIEKIFDQTHPKDYKRFRDTVISAMETGEDYEIEYCFLRPNGEEKIAYVKGDGVFDEDGNLNRFIGVIQDITVLRETEYSLKENRDQARMIYDSLEATIWSMNMRNKALTFVSKSVETLTGIKRRVFENNIEIWREVIHPSDQEMFDEMQIALESGEKTKHQYRIIHISGDIRWVEDQTIPVLDNENNLIRLDGIVTDITERKRYEEHMEYIANQDHMTGLFNRRHFEHHLAETVEKARNEQKGVSVFYLDIDNFKFTIDVLGHKTGDNVIKMVAQQLHRFVHSRGAAARIGGDEFALCITHPQGIEHADKILNELNKAFENSMKVDGYDIQVSISIGISAYPEHSQDADTLIKAADIALFEAKRSGKGNSKMYEHAMTDKADRLYQMGRDLRKAIGTEEMYLEYQPKVDARTGKIVGAEALSRWIHPQWGAISPAVFIPIAEQHGWIDDLSHWSLACVCAFIRGERLLGHDIVPVSVNISPRWLLKANFTEKVIEIINHYQVPPELIEFEITETHMIQNEALVDRILNKLKAFGLRFALDDFGTGFSTVSHLSQFDIDILKIDRALIKDIKTSEKNQRIVEGIAYIAKNLDIEVIVEGVETMEELNFLLQQNCSYIQGYIYSRPLKEMDFKTRLAERILQPVV